MFSLRRAIAELTEERREVGSLVDRHHIVLVIYVGSTSSVLVRNIIENISGHLILAFQYVTGMRSRQPTKTSKSI
jgi:hypothetical protein